MNGKKRSKRKSSLPILFLVSLISILFFMPTVIADNNMGVSFDPLPSQEPPVISNVYPANGSTGIGLQITCHIKVSDANNDDLNVTWSSSTDGQSWNDKQINSSLHTGDVTYWAYLEATSYNTKYYWRVKVDDGTFTTTAIYHFTTKSSGGAPPSPPPPDEEPRINEEPIANITGPRNGYVGQSLVFYAGYSYDPDGYITGYRWDFNNDGLFDTDWQENEFVSHIYSSPGDYTVKLQVQDNDSATATDSYVITIREVDPDKQLPVAEANGPYEGLVNETISFNATGSYDPDGVIVSYIWDFGDQNTSQLKNPIHVYAKPGNYTVILTVIDNQGLSNMDLTVVVVKPLTPEEPPEEPEERALPLTLIGMIVCGILAAIIIALVIFKRERGKKRKPYQPLKKQKHTALYSQPDGNLVKDVEEKVDNLLIEKTNQKVDDLLQHNSNGRQS